MRYQNYSGGYVYEQCDCADNAHQASLRFSERENAINRCAEYSTAKRTEENALNKRRPRAPAETPFHREDSKTSNQAVAKKIERVSFESLRPSHKASDNLDETIANVKKHYCPECTPIYRRDVT